MVSSAITTHRVLYHSAQNVNQEQIYFYAVKFNNLKNIHQIEKNILLPAILFDAHGLPLAVMNSGPPNIFSPPLLYRLLCRVSDLPCCQTLT